MTIHNSETATLFVNSVEIDQILTLSGPSISVGEVSTTNLASTSKTRRASVMPDGGTVSVTFQWDWGLHSSLSYLAVASGQANVPCVLTYPDSTEVTFSAYINSLEISAGGEDTNLEASMELMISGAVTFDGGA